MAEIITTFPIGTKIYNYVDGKPFIHRVYKCDHTKQTYDFKCIYPAEYAGISSHRSFDFVHKNFIKLNPDGYITCAIVKGEVSDVMVCLHKVEKQDGATNTDVADVLPHVVCRQDVIDIFKMANDQTSVFSGCSVSRKSCPPQIPLQNFMQCDEITYTQMASVYLDDTLDDILSFFFLQRFDKILAARAEKHRKEGHDNVKDNFYTLHDLLKGKEFMYDFHETFDITEVPFPIKNGVEHLLADIVSQLIQKVVTNVYITEYTKLVDTTEFNRPYVLVTPDSGKAKKEDQKVFFVGYDVDESADYMEKQYGTNDKDELIKKMGFQVL